MASLSGAESCRLFTVTTNGFVHDFHYHQMHDHQDDDVEVFWQRTDDASLLQALSFGQAHTLTYDQLNQITVGDLDHHLFDIAINKNILKTRKKISHFKCITSNGLQFSLTYRPAELFSSQSNLPW